LHFGLPAALQEDLDLLLRRLQACLAVPGERHAALEGPQRLIERHIAPLESLYEALELRQGFFKINGFVIG
jgi:hypothetical protein